MTDFWETMLLPTLKGKIFYNFFKTCAKYGQDPVQDLDQEQNLFKSRNRNRNKALRFHNTNELKVKTLRKVPSTNFRCFPSPLLDCTVLQDLASDLNKTFRMKFLTLVQNFYIFLALTGDNVALTG